MKWTEVNITPASSDHDRFLLEVIEPFVSASDLESWHFLWEPQEGWKRGDKSDQSEVVLRFRILSADPLHRKSLIATLEKAKDEGVIRDFYQGAHGVRADKYQGEELLYGSEVWTETYRLWHALSALALKLAGDPELPRSHHWKRTAHLSANMFRLPDVRLNLEQGHRYLQVKRTAMAEEPSAADRKVMKALDEYLYPEDVI